jgi:hypothetical protein
MARFRRVAANTASSSSKPTAEPAPDRRQIQYSVLPDPAKGSTTTDPEFAGTVPAIADMSLAINSASLSRVHSTAVRPRIRTPRAYQSAGFRP